MVLLLYLEDLLKINDEIVRVDSVGIGTSTNNIRVRRTWMGTTLAAHAASDLVTKVEGDYNIVDNVLNFISAPIGPNPISSTTNPPILETLLESLHTLLLVVELSWIWNCWSNNRFLQKLRV